MIGLDDSANTSPVVASFIGDGYTIKSVSLSPGSLPQTIVIPLTGVNKLSITVAGAASPGGSLLTEGQVDVDLANAVLTH